MFHAGENGKGTRMLKAISLFTGVGGLDFGFEAAGFETAAAVEMDAVSCHTLRLNRRWPVIERDIHEVTSKELLRTAKLKKGQADVLIGGPPCQPFSKSGYWARGDALRLDDPRADTLTAYLRVLRDAQPKTFLLENVSGLAYKGKSEGLDRILAGVEQINRETGSAYRPVWQVVDAASYGVPQHRERVIIVASRDGKPFRFPKITHGEAPLSGSGRQAGCAPDLFSGFHDLEPWRTTWDALGDLPERPNEQLSLTAEVSVIAAKEALSRAGRSAEDVDAVICSCSSLQRPYPALAIEVQNALGAGGFGYDMNVACSSATFAIQNACDIVRAGHARSVLVVNPELCTGHLNLRDRDTHFIFGDAAVAILVEHADIAPPGAWAILGTKLRTRFSNNIRNNFGFLNRCDPQWAAMPDKLITQRGRKVFKEVVPMVSEMILAHMAELELKPSDLRRMWLHQANSNMNRLIAERILGREATQDESPTVLDTYGNTAGAGSIIAFHLNSQDLKAGDRGLICSFGAGYSAGTVFIAKAA